MRVIALKTFMKQGKKYRLKLVNFNNYSNKLLSR